MTVQIPLANGRGFALVDDADAELVSRYRWHRVAGGKRSRTFYARTAVSRGPWRYLTMHILIMGQRGIDHRDSNGLNNRRSNLRPATQAQQAANMQPCRDNSSPFKGVSWDKRSGKWRSQIKICGRSHHLSYFTDEAEAARAYDVAALEAWGEYARLNFPLQES